jgi:hypothetical protein
MVAHFSGDPDMEWVLLDSTIVRAHPCAAGAPKKNGGQAEQSLGRSRGGFGTKIHGSIWIPRRSIFDHQDKLE